MYYGEMSHKFEREKFILLPKVINGGLAGIIGTSCIFPLDLVKTRLQNQQLGPNGEKMYRSLFDCFTKTFRSEGFLGMYRGLAINILLITPEKAIKLTCNDFFRYHFTTADGKLPMFNQMCAAGVTGIFPIIVTTPMELIKIQLQDAGRVASQAKLLGKHVETPTMSTIIKLLLKQRGIFGLYKGLTPTIARDIPFAIIYFPLFATLNAMGPRRENTTGEAVFWWSLISGLGAGSCAAFSVTPLDVMKTRLQALKKAEGEKEFSGILDCLVKTFKYEGPLAFFKGGMCRVIVIAPLFGIAQMVYYLGVAEAILDEFS